MTLNESIKHCEEVFDIKKREAENAELCGCERYARKCEECASEHKQLAEWLKELKMRTTEVKRTDRGWAGHFIGARYCNFRRNTLLEYHNRKWVISTVGGYINSLTNEPETIGINRWYETMAFVADNTPYHDADVSREIHFVSPWGIFAESIDELRQKHPYVDNEADEMHEKVVEELTVKIQEYKH